ncbi:MAG TPA: FliH/SctL family protein [Burkholderiaceae bacterium]|nr:FliH/SctL family protein [Burkholderiaceae bacterium]
MSSSNPKPASHPYGRFIPREELQGFASWKPGAFGDAVGGAAASDSAEQQASAHAARQAGYQEGYRDGLVALENFRRGVLQSNAAQFGMLLQQFDEQLDALELEMARSLARVAASIAQQVVRDELVAQPQRIARVAQEAVEAVLLSARHIVVQVNPQDLPLVEQGATDALASRGARLVADPAIERGGCRVLSDVGTIDARISARWDHASASIGAELPWSTTAAGLGGADDDTTAR